MEELVLIDPRSGFRAQLPTEPETPTCQYFWKPALLQCASFGNQVILLPSPIWSITQLFIYVHSLRKHFMPIRCKTTAATTTVLRWSGTEPAAVVKNSQVTGCHCLHTVYSMVEGMHYFFSTHSPCCAQGTATNINTFILHHPKIVISPFYR